MAESRSIKFAEAAQNRRLVTLLLQRGIPFSVTKDGTVRYPGRFDEVVDSQILSPLRRRVFPKWQVLSFPPDWATVYGDYMRQRKLPFVPEWVNGQLVYLLPASYRPHTWTLPDPSTAAGRPAKAYATA